jgi:hypothetical protein
MKKTILILAAFLACCGRDDRARGFSGGGFLPGPGKSGGGGTGTVSSVSGGTGVTVVNPTTTPSVSLDSTVWQKRVGGTAAANAAITQVNSDGSVGTATFYGDSNYPNNYADPVLEWSDEFMWSQPAANSTNPDGWLGTNINGTGAAISGSVTGATGRPGIVDIATGTLATGRSALTTGASAIDLGSGLWSFVGVCGVPALSSSTDGFAWLLGIFDVSNAVDQTDGCYYLLDERQIATAPATGARPAQGSSTLAIVCSSNSARTEYPLDGVTHDDSGAATGAVTAAALTLPNTNMLNLEVREVSSSEVDFYANSTKVGVITTHIPTGSARLTGAGTLIIKSVGTTSRDVQCDRMRLKVSSLPTRSP